MKVHPRATAGLLYLLPGIGISAGWFGLLFVSNPPGVTPLGTAHFVLTQGPTASWYRWLLSLPVFFFILAAAYVSPLSKGRTCSMLLFALGLAVAIACWLTVGVDIAVFATIPLVFGFLTIRAQGANNRVT